MIGISRGKQTLAVLAIATLAFTGLSAAAPAHAAPARQNVYTMLAGTWLGEALGDGGGCNGEYGQFTFFRNGEYAYTSNSNACGGFTNAGYFRVHNGILTLHWVECNYPCSPGTASTGFAFRGVNAFDLFDAGRTYEYYRQ